MGKNSVRRKHRWILYLVIIILLICLWLYNSGMFEKNSDIPSLEVYPLELIQLPDPDIPYGKVFIGWASDIEGDEENLYYDYFNNWTQDYVILSPVYVELADVFDYDVNIFLLKNIIGLKEGYDDITVMGLPDDISSIGDNVFFGSNIMRVFFSEDSKLTVIGENSFASSSIEEFSLPDRVMFIGPAAFRNCEYLSAFHIGENSLLREIGDKAFEGASLSKIFIPHYVSSIPSYAFSGSQIESVSFADNSRVKEIGDYAFSWSQIRSISMPSSLNSIGNEAFSSCYELNSIEGLETSELVFIGDGAFSWSALKNIVLPSSLSHIGEDAFGMVYLLEDADLSSCTALKNIPSACFRYCISLEQINLPASVELIDDEAFLYSGISKVLIPADSNLHQIGERAFAGCTIYDLTLSEGLEFIADNAFEYSYLTNLILPDSLRSIGANAFINAVIKRLEIPPHLANSIGNWGVSDSVDIVVREADFD